MKEKTAAAYARYSTDNQTENSIEYQMHEITGYCLKNHIKLTHQFVDEGCSGTNTDRASFQRMIEAARRGEFSNIIIYDISRGSRDVADWFSFRRLMRELHVNVISCHQQLGDPLDPDAFLREFISVGLGQHMVLETRQKSLDGMDAAARKGLFLGGVTPFGFGVKNQRYFIVESEAVIVREVFRLYADGYSYDYIMEKLDLSHVIGRHGAPMSRNSLYYMLKNARYAGIYTWNAHTYQVMRKYVGRQGNPRKTSIPSGAIPPIVDMETFLRVQERMKKNKNRTSRPPIKKRVFLLSGLIHCARCGSNYFAHVSRAHGREYLYYCCGNRYGIRRKRYGCKSDPIRGEALEAFVIDAVKQCLLRGTDFVALAEEIAARFAKQQGAEDVTAQRRELASVNTRIQNGLKAILSGFDDDDLRVKIADLKEKKAKLEIAISTAENIGRAVNVPALAAMLRQDVENLQSRSREEIQHTIRQHVPHIIANEDGTLTVTVGYLLPGAAQRHYQKSPDTQKTPENQGLSGVVCSVAGAVGDMFITHAPSYIAWREFIYMPCA